MGYKNNSNTGLIIVADCMLLSVEYIGNVHLFFNSKELLCKTLLQGGTTRKHSHLHCQSI